MAHPRFCGSFIDNRWKFDVLCAHTHTCAAIFMGPFDPLLFLLSFVTYPEQIRVAMVHFNASEGRGVEVDAVMEQLIGYLDLQGSTKKLRGKHQWSGLAWMEALCKSLLIGLWHPWAQSHIFGLSQANGADRRVGAWAEHTDFTLVLRWGFKRGNCVFSVKAESFKNRPSWSQLFLFCMLSDCLGDSWGEKVYGNFSGTFAAPGKDPHTPWI